MSFLCASADGQYFQALYQFFSLSSKNNVIVHLLH